MELTPCQETIEFYQFFIVKDKKISQNKIHNGRKNIYAKTANSNEFAVFVKCSVETLLS